MPDWLSGVLPSELRRRVAARRRGARVEDVDDAIQDVLLGILQTLRSERVPAAPRNSDAYLLRAVHNRLNSMQRTQHRRGSAPGDGAAVPAEQLASPDLAPDQQHEAGERARCFARLVSIFAGPRASPAEEGCERAFRALQAVLAERLSDQQWILVRMRVLEGIRIVDCARALGVSVGTAHNWARQALALCRVTLEEAGIDAGQLWYEADRGG